MDSESMFSRGEVPKSGDPPRSATDTEDPDGDTLREGTAIT